MKLELKILYLLATLTVVPKDVLISLLSYDNEDAKLQLTDAPTLRAVYNVIRRLIREGEIDETTAEIKRKNLKPLHADMLTITRAGVQYLKEHGQPDIPWSKLLPTNIGRIVGSGRTTARLATQYCRMSAAAMMAMSVGAREIFLSPDADDDVENKTISLLHAVQTAREEFDREDEEIIRDEDEVSFRQAASSFVPALAMKRSLADRYGPASNNEKQSGQCAGAYFIRDKAIIVYVAMRYSVPKFTKWALEQDVALVKTYAADILDHKIGTLSSVLLVSDAATFHAAFRSAEGQRTEIDKGKYRFRKMRMTAAAYYDHMYVIPFSQFGRSELSDLLFGTSFGRTTADLFNALCEQAPYVAVNGVYSSVNYFKDTHTDTLFSILLHLDMVSIDSIKRYMRMNTGAHYGLIVPETYIDFYRMAFRDCDMEFVPLGSLFETYDLDELYDRYRPVLDPGLDPMPKMYIEREGELARREEADIRRFFARSKRKYTRHNKKNKELCENQTEQSALPVLEIEELHLID